jgi:hypothetical protein
VFTSGEVADAVAPDPLSDPVPMFDPPVLQPVAVWVGPHMKNVTVPDGVSAAWLPTIVAVSCTAVPGGTAVPFVDSCVVIVAVSSWLTYVHVTSPSGLRLIDAVSPDVLTDEPDVESAEQVRLSNV